MTDMQDQCLSPRMFSVRTFRGDYVCDPQADLEAGCTVVALSPNGDHAHGRLVTEHPNRARSLSIRHLAADGSETTVRGFSKSRVFRAVKLIVDLRPDEDG